MDRRELGFECENAIAFLCEHMVNDGWKKPSLFHSIRVGTHLYEQGYGKNIVIAGFLHDIIEDGANVSEEKLNSCFGERVLQIVKANSINKDIDDKQKKKEDLIDRCVLMGEEALIIKASDIIDNFFYYNMTKNSEEIISHCIPLAKLLLEKKPENFTDNIFDHLKVVINENCRM